MSKENPEVGDIWIDKETCQPVLIIDTGIFKDEITCVGGQFWKNHFDLITFKRWYKYIGKSVCDINRLFEVRDEI